MPIPYRGGMKALFVLLVCNVSFYCFFRDMSDALAIIRTRPQCREAAFQPMEFFSQNMNCMCIFSLLSCEIYLNSLAGIRKILYICNMKYRAYKYRLYPNEEQKVLIAKHLGSCRFIYNYSSELVGKLW